MKKYTYLATKKETKYEGRKNQTILPDFVNICKKTQKELIEYLPQMLLASGYTDVVQGKGYIYAKGSVPVLLTAHMDTVHKERIVDYYEREENGKHILASPQGIGGDDRCGIYMILKIIQTHKCSVLFCEDEEVGGVGSSAFTETEMIHELSELNYLIELDRANENDAVFYSCDNPDFTKFITENTGYKKSWGSFSDISILSPACKVASVNLSCGYYHAHTLYEEVVIEEMLNTIEVVKKLLDIESEKFEFIGNEYGGYYGYSRYSGYYSRSRSYYYDDDDDDYSYYRKETYKDNTIMLYAYTRQGEYYSTGCSKDEAWRKLFFSNPDLCYNDVYDFEYYEC